MVLSAFHVLRRCVHDQSGSRHLPRWCSTAGVGRTTPSARSLRSTEAAAARGVATPGDPRVVPWFGTGQYLRRPRSCSSNSRSPRPTTEAHNDYLQLLVEGGWLVAVLALVRCSCRRRCAAGSARAKTTGRLVRPGAVTVRRDRFQEIVEFSLQMPKRGLFILCAIAVRKALVKPAVRRV
jgi:hypothetical protein